MFSTKIQLNVETAVAQAKEPAKATQGHSRAYHAPQLHDAGKATELVQGGGGNTADNNRARQY
jgi:hypothetical protein